MAYHRYRNQFARCVRCSSKNAQRRRPANETTSSYSTDDCPHRAFAKTHPKAAADVLAVPSHSPLSSHEPFLFKDGEFLLERYVEWRGWNIEGILHKHNLLEGDAGLGGDDGSLLHSALGLLSHPLTFPLTLGGYIHKLQEINTTQRYLRGGDDSDNGKWEKQHVRICCVGARAECTLPDVFWREFLVAVAPGVRCKYTVDFVGPDVPRHLKSKTITFPDGQGVPIQQATQSELTLNFHTAHLHEVVLAFLKAPHGDVTSNEKQSSPSGRAEKIQQFWNGGFALFNPGLGHPNLQKQWSPTLEFLVGTGKPILVTAHSKIDANRDRLLLKRFVCEDKLSDYEINPFASRMEFVDPCSSSSDSRGVHVVRPNHSYLILP